MIERKSLLSSARDALVGALLIAAVCTAFDYVWNELIPRDHGPFLGIIIGLAHGGILFALLGGYLGNLQGSAKARVVGVIGGLSCGFAASAAFYILWTGGVRPMYSPRGCFKTPSWLPRRDAASTRTRRYLPLHRVNLAPCLTPTERVLKQPLRVHRPSGGGPEA